MWKNLKGYFVIEEEGQLKPKTSTLPDKRTKTPAGTAGPSEGTAPASPPPTASADGKVEEKFVDVLLQAMEKANLPGFDYLEYKKALENLQKMNLDDASRYQAAYAAAQSMGVTPAQLVDSANHYLTALKQEQDKFTRAVANQQDDQVTKKQAQLEQLDGSVAEQEKKIKALQEQITQTRKQQETLRQSVEESKEKIASTAADFRKTYETITGNIEADVAKMGEYLK